MKKETIAGLLEQQVMQPVRFYESIHKLKTIGIEQVIEVGPGKVLSGFMKKLIKRYQFCVLKISRHLMKQ